MTNPNNNSNKALVLSDIHGSYTKLKQALEPHYGSGKQLIVLGDLIDRAPETDGDLNVVRLIHDLCEDPASGGFSKVVCLRGNHEEMFLQLKMKSTPSRREMWMINGGDPSFYSSVGKYLPWLDSLPLKYVAGKYLFVHAGVKPNVELKKQRKHDMLWIREEFLSTEDHGLPYHIIHGHTVCDDFSAEFYENRTCIEPGSWFGGPCTMIEVDLEDETTTPYVVSETFESALV